MGEQAISKKARRVEDVRRRILTQVFEPGSYLDEAELAQPYYISRTPLREALHQLPAENATEAQVMQLKDTQELFRKAIREGDAAGRALMNQRIHAIIGEMVDNEFLRPSLRRLLIDRTRIGMSFYNPGTRSMAEQRSVAADQHDQFIALIEQGDVEGATSLPLTTGNCRGPRSRALSRLWECRSRLAPRRAPGCANEKNEVRRHLYACHQAASRGWQCRPGGAGSIEYLIASGVHGLINGGSTGEYYAQSLEERPEIASFARDVIGDRVPLIVGTVAIRLEDSVAMAEHAARIGADALLVGSPPYSVPTERENALNALAIDRAADLPIMLYNCLGRMGIDMGEAFLDRVGRSRNFCAIKESSGDINRVHLLARD